MAESAQLGFAGTDRFRVLRELGQGGMGVVYLAEDRERHREVALKTLLRLDAQAVYRLKNEFRSLQGIEHPNLVRIEELVCAAGVWFFTMEYVEGVDLLTYVRPAGFAAPRPDVGTRDLRVAEGDDPSVTRGTRPIANPVRAARELFDETRLRSVLRQLALGLRALHRHNKIHRDIKPSNVLVTPAGRAVLLDFGIVVDSQEAGESSPHPPTVEHAGTAAYMAPEQAMSNPLTPASDWYAFGVIMYRALVGHLPFLGTPTEILLNKQKFEPPAPRVLVPDVPEDLNDLCVDLLRFAPAARPSEREILDRFGVSPQLAEPAATMSSQFTQTMPFIGRAGEHAWIERAFADSKAAAVTAFVEGGSGVGKSELVRRFGDWARDRDPQILLLPGRCYEREHMPYKALDGVIDSLSRFLNRLPQADASALLPLRASLLPQLFPVLARVEVFAQAPREPAQTQTLDPQEQRARRFGALRELLQRLAQRYRVVLVIDDFQWADADSLGLLEEVLRGPDAPAMLIIGTVNTDAGGNADAYAARLPGDVRILRLSHLPELDARELIEQLSPALAREHPESVRAILHETGGHPLFIQELVRHAQAGQGASAETLRLSDAIAARLARLSDEAQHLLAILCVAGAPISQEVALHASELEAARFDKAIALLRVAYFARTSGTRRSDPVEPYHDRIRAAVLDSLDADRRRHWHGRLARALTRAGAATRDPQVLVHHLEAAGQLTEAAQYAVDSAARAARALAFDRAAQLYRTALELGEFDAEAERAHRLELGEALVNAGRGKEAAEVFLAASEGADPATRLSCRRRAAEQLLISGHIEQGLDAMRLTLAEIGVRIPETQRAALFSLARGRAWLRLRGLGWRERHVREIADADLIKLDVFKAVSHGLGLVDPLRGGDFQVRGLRLALAVGERKRVARSFFFEACFLAGQGGRRLERAYELVAKGAAIADGSGDSYLMAWRQGTDGFLAYFSGRFRTAVEHFTVADRLLRTECSGAFWELGTMLQFRLQSLWYLGAFEEMRPLFEHGVRDAANRGDRYAESTVRRSCSLLWLAADDEASALRDLSFEWASVEGGMQLQHFYELRSRVDLALYQGRAAAALPELRPGFVRFFASLLKRVPIVRACALQMLARLVLAVAGEPADARLLAEAEHLAAKLTRERLGYSGMWAHLVRAGVAARRGQPERAIGELRRTITDAEEHQMMGYASAARWHQAQLLGGSEGEVLRRRAGEWLAEQKVVQPARLIGVLAPGFGAPG